MEWTNNATNANMMMVVRMLDEVRLSYTDVGEFQVPFDTTSSIDYILHENFIIGD